MIRQCELPLAINGQAVLQQSRACIAHQEEVDPGSGELGQHRIFINASHGLQGTPNEVTAIKRGWQTQHFPPLTIATLISCPSAMHHGNEWIQSLADLLKASL